MVHSIEKHLLFTLSGTSATRFGKISPLLQKDESLTAYFLFGKMLSLIWQIWNIIGIISIVADGKILKLI